MALQGTSGRWALSLLVSLFANAHFFDAFELCLDPISKTMQMQCIASMVLISKLLSSLIGAV